MKRTFAVIFGVALFLLVTAVALKNVTHSIAQREHVKLLETLLPNSTNFQRIDCDGEDEIIRSVHKAAGGYVIETATMGYADEIVMFIGVDNGGTVTGLVAYEAHETNGLGNQILTDHVFLSQFLNKSGTFSIASSHGDDVWDTNDKSASTNKNITVDGISGATVSSKAVAKCVNAAVAYVTGADIESSATSWGE